MDTELQLFSIATQFGMVHHRNISITDTCSTFSARTF